MDRLEPNLFLEFAEHRLLRALSDFYAALRELPRVFPDPLTPEDLVCCVAQNNSYVRAIAVTVDHVSHPKNPV
jgi:hypothetical protein